MNALKTYSVSLNIVSGTLDLGKLHAAIAASNAVFGLSGLNLDGDIISVLGGSISDEAALDAVVSAHEAVCLSDLKVKKNAVIDARTQELIAQGFTFDGHGFSLSPAAQMNWSGLKTFETLLTWPVKVTASGDVEYSLAQANLIPFVGTALGTVAAHYTSGRALKLQVNACETAAQVEAVVDSR